MSNLGDRPAFPRPTTDYGPGQEGMSYRQWLAGVALQGNLAGSPDAFLEPDMVAIRSVEYADALISELEKPHGQLD